MINVRKGRGAWVKAIEENIPIIVWIESIHILEPTYAVDRILGLYKGDVSELSTSDSCPTEDHIPECVNILLYKLSYLFLHDKIAGEDVNEGGSI